MFYFKSYYCIGCIQKKVIKKEKGCLFSKMSKIPAGYIKPKVGIIYSDVNNDSNESKNLAFYLCGHLVSTGYSEVVLVSHNIDNSYDNNLNKSRINYIPGGNINAKPIEAPSSDISYGNYSALEICHIIIVTVNSNDTESCVSKLDEVVQTKPNMTLFSIQRGVKNACVLKEKLNGKSGAVVMDCVCGFAVVPHPKNGSLVSTFKYPKIVMERMSKEVFKVADGPCRLIESVNGIEVTFKKILTPFSWGVLVYENLHALNALHRGTLISTFNDYECRCILATMTRECRKALEKAAGSGKWLPDLFLITSISFVDLWVYEIILVLPLFLGSFLLWICGISPSQVISPIQLDLNERRKTMIEYHLAELVSTGTRYNVAMPVTAAVLMKLEEAEKATEPRSLAANYMKDIREATFLENGNRKTLLSFLELRFWTFRLVTLLSILLLLYFLFIHDD